MYKGRVEPVLVFLSNSYSDNTKILVYDSKPFLILPTCSTDY